MIEPESIDANALYAQALTAIGAKDRATARQLLATVVWADPLHEAGWLMLSTVVEDPARSIECLRHVLALNPDNAKARHWLALAERAVAREAEQPKTAELAGAPAALTSRPDPTDDFYFEPLAPEDQPVPRLGRYLLDYKFIRPDQLAEALAAQEAEAPRLLGEILVAQGVLAADRLEFVLREQQRVRASLAAGTPAQ